MSVTNTNCERCVDAKASSSCVHCSRKLCDTCIAEGNCYDANSVYRGHHESSPPAADAPRTNNLYECTNCGYQVINEEPKDSSLCRVCGHNEFKTIVATIKLCPECLGGDGAHGKGCPKADVPAPALTGTQPVCSWCQSDRVTADANVEWDAQSRKWEINNVFEKGAYCNNCDGETVIEWADHEGVLTGQCSTCGHHGDDCKGWKIRDEDEDQETACPDCGAKFDGGTDAGVVCPVCNRGVVEVQ